MEEEVNYATVVFKAKDKPQEPEIIYDELKAEEQESDTKPVLPAQNLQLWTEKTDLQRQTEELTREKDGLNWTIGFIMEYEVFPVKAFCPQKVCKPCMDGWLLFQSKCYLFHESVYSYWKSWEDSRKECKRMNADLVVIESQEEQEFINNHTKEGRYEDYGYWIGLSTNDVTNTWMWVNGRNLTVTYWKAEEGGIDASCAHILPQKKPEEPTIYSEVKPSGSAATVPVSLIVDEQEANLSNLTAENQQLITSRNILQTKTDELSRINDRFNWTLSTILTFDNFPVNEYCPEKKCQPCRKNWILFQEKCYLIYLKDSPWLTWADSRKYCQRSSADLVVIDSLQEQEFISNHSQSYYDAFHGYWMGLYEWRWIDGRNDTLK
ncbi:hypothetical protein GBF38_013898 [Nibea albiflora]|uniref:Uncharacterized protein n=1 Tax=Nibea albiflora TaxID=240163 RepID=A0ACB7F9X3_NIBAL|nr:hypothetical protein GBF38_013898 [Nibea albiflora]